MFFFEMIMLLYLCFCMLGIIIILSLFILPCIAAPIYSGMIFLEFYISLGNQEIPRFLQFRQPKDFSYKFSMDCIAAFCTIIGGFVTLDFIENQHNLGGFWKLFFEGKIMPSPFIVAFSLSLFCLYFISNKCELDERTPIVKLKEVCKISNFSIFLKK